jgi:hypothetical protein
MEGSVFKTFATVAILAVSLGAGAAQVPLNGAVALEAGGGFACALMSNGGVQCFGANDSGQLGDGLPTQNRIVANYVSGLSGGVAALGVSRGGDRGGPAHACAVLSSDGSVKCWGSNAAGQLGNGASGANQPLPVSVIGLGGPATAVALGTEHTCALLADKTVRCWGDAVAVGHGAASPQPTPIAVPELTNVSAITAAARHTCALLGTGAVKCWGSNDRGQLGNGTTTSSPVAVDVASLSGGIVAISAGGGRPANAMAGSFTCALTTAGGVKCWGANHQGQVGDGTQTDRLTPFDVAGLTSGVAQISTGGMPFLLSHLSEGAMAHACVVPSAGGLKCWGSNRCAQAGPGGGGCGFNDGQVRLTPQDVPLSGLSVTKVAAGGGFNCLLTGLDGNVKCFGTSAPFSSPQAAVQILTGTTPQGIFIGAKPNVPVGGNGQLAVNAWGGSGNPPTYQLLTPAICTLGPFSGGVDIFGGSQGKCRFTINQAGNAYYDPAPELLVEVRIGDKLPQAITLGPAPASVPVQGVGVLQATASSGNRVAFVSNTPSICTTQSSVAVYGEIVTGLAVGQCTVTASQPGDDFYLAAQQVTQTFPVVANSGTHSLTVGVGGGGGTVVSSPAGINCGSTCAANFTAGIPITVNATPSPGYVFAGWSSPGGCIGMNSICNFTIGAPQVILATFVPTPPPRLFNLSTRAKVAAGENAMIAGFVVAGGGKAVAIVATGPSLASHGIPNPLSDPRITLVNSLGQVVDSNDNWQSASNSSQLTAAGLAPSNPLEAGLVVSLAGGPYTAVVQGAGSESGVSVVGVYELTLPNYPLINLSTRGRVETGNDVMIGGFIIEGNAPRTVAVVATGPSLSAFGIANPLMDPHITLVRSADQSVVASNDDWQSDANAAQLQAAGFAPTNPKEAGLYVTLPPGAYTAVVRGVGGTTGVAVIGVYRGN